MKKSALSLLLVPALLLGGSCRNYSTPPLPTNSPKSSTYDSSVARSWMDNAYLWVKAGGTNPPQASRLYGYFGVTLWEAVAHGVANAQSLAGIATGLDSMPEPEAGQVYNWALVANAAIAEVARALMPTFVPDIDALEDDLAAANAADADVEARSIAYGLEVAAAIIAWADADGFADVAACDAAFVPPPVSGAWTGTGLGLHPCWGQQRTFLLTDSAECVALGHPSFTTTDPSAFYAAAYEVYATTGDVGASLTADEQDIARYWGDGPTATGTPPGHWVAATGIVLRSRPAYDRLDTAAQAYARVGMAVADAFIVCWREKFETYLMRPITYIKANIDPNWDPLLSTPNFPTYTSGHSTQSGAAATALTEMFGAIAFTDTTHSDLNPELLFTDRSFLNFHQAANEAKVSRLYGGIHYVFDNQDGYELGEDLASIQNARLAGVFN